MYVMLQGLPGVRKSTAINIGTKLLKKVGYKKFASNRMSRQMFLEELHAINKPDLDNMTFDEMLDLKDDAPAEISIHASEFLDFIGQGDKDYLMLITSLWDNLDEYKNPKITSKSVSVKNPTVNFIGGNTPAGLNLAFPAETIDAGTLSRFIFIHAQSNGRKILIPSRPDSKAEVAIIEHLNRIKTEVRGKATVTPEALEVLEFIYNEAKAIEDPRFSYYHSRRLTHLIKLCLIVSATRISTEITADDVLQANTILGAAEHSMPKALGHFGRSKNSAAIHSMLEYIEEAGKPVMPKDLYSRFSADFSKEAEFTSILMDLQVSNRIVAVRTPDGTKLEGLMVIEQEFPKWLEPLMVLEELTKQEREVIGL